MFNYRQCGAHSANYSEHLLSQKEYFEIKALAPLRFVSCHKCLGSISLKLSAHELRLWKPNVRDWTYTFRCSIYHCSLIWLIAPTAVRWLCSKAKSSGAAHLTSPRTSANLSQVIAFISLIRNGKSPSKIAAGRGALRMRNGYVRHDLPHRALFYSRNDGSYIYWTAHLVLGLLDFKIIFIFMVFVSSGLLYDP